MGLGHDLTATVPAKDWSRPIRVRGRMGRLFLWGEGTRTVNRIIEFFREPDDEREGVGDFYCVSGEFGWCYVSAETARKVEVELDRWRLRRWIRFRDLFGSEIRVRTREVDQVKEFTEEQRRRYRAFDRAREQEKKAERRWEDE